MAGEALVAHNGWLRVKFKRQPLPRAIPRGNGVNQLPRILARTLSWNESGKDTRLRRRSSPSLADCVSIVFLADSVQIDFS